MSGVKDFLHCLRLALREVFRPEPFVDEDPQSTDEATAARTAWVQANRLSDEEVRTDGESTTPADAAGQ